MKKEPTNPFQIQIGHNPQMGCFEIMLQVGNIKSKKDAEAFADVLRDWMIQDSDTAWAKRVQ
jgi:hypothetical protein